MRFHDVLKVAAESVLCTATRTGDQEGGFEGRVMVVEKRFGWSEERKVSHTVNEFRFILPVTQLQI